MTTGDMGGMVAWLVTYLVHSTVLLGAAWVLTRWAVQSQQARDVIWKVAMVGALFSPVVQMMMERDPMAGRIEIPATPLRTADVSTPATTAIMPAPGNSPAESPRPVPSAPSRWAAVSLNAVMFWTWVATAVVLSLLYVLRRVVFSARLGRRQPVRDGRVDMLVHELARDAGMARMVRLTRTPHLSSPVALGLSEICLPEAALEELDPDQQRSMLAHEVAHLARRDPAWLFAACLIERIWFFQPLNRVARHRMQEAAEFLCDDWAARRTGSGLTLAKCLVKVAEWIDTTPHPVPVSGMAEARSQFVSRIHRLIANRGLAAEPPRRWLLPSALACVALVVAAAPGARAGERLFGVSTVTPVHEPSEPAMTPPVTTRVPAAGRREPQAARTPQDTGIVAALLVALKDPDVEVRRAAASSLGNLRSARAVPGLIEALKDEDTELRRYVVEALGNLRDARAAAGLLAALRDRDAQVRAAAAEAVGDLREGDVVGPLTALLGDSSVQVRRSAIDALKDLERARPVDAFITALKDEDREVREAAADGLGNMEDRRAVRPLIAALSDASAQVRHNAAHSLGHLGDRAAVEPLAAAIKDASADVRTAAIEALGELELSEAPQGILDALRDTNADVRQAAIHSVGHIGDPRAVPPLATLLNDNDPDVREAAVEALSEIRDAAAIEALVAAMKSRDANVRKRAAEALGERN